MVGPIRSGPLVTFNQEREVVPSVKGSSFEVRYAFPKRTKRRRRTYFSSHKEEEKGYTLSEDKGDAWFSRYRLNPYGLGKRTFETIRHRELEQGLTNLNREATIARGLNQSKSRLYRNISNVPMYRRRVHHMRRHHRHRRHHHHRHSMRARTHHIMRMWNHQAYSLRVNYPHYLKLTSNAVKELLFINQGVASSGPPLVIPISSGAATITPHLGWFMGIDNMEVL